MSARSLFDQGVREGPESDELDKKLVGGRINIDRRPKAYKKADVALDADGRPIRTEVAREEGEPTAQGDGA